MIRTLLEIYREKCAAGEIAADARQEEAVAALDALGRTLAAGQKKGLWQRLFPRTRAPDAPSGFYFYGAVGRGKTMVMDMFFAHVPVVQKRRVQFHAFMLEAYDFLHTYRATRMKKEKIDGALLAFAAHVAETVRLLCFDDV